MTPIKWARFQCVNIEVLYSACVPSSSSLHSAYLARWVPGNTFWRLIFRRWADLGLGNTGLAFQAEVGQPNHLLWGGCPEVTHRSKSFPWATEAYKTLVMLCTQLTKVLWRLIMACKGLWRWKVLVMEINGLSSNAFFKPPRSSCLLSAVLDFQEARMSSEVRVTSAVLGESKGLVQTSSNSTETPCC